MDFLWIEELLFSDAAAIKTFFKSYQLNTTAKDIQLKLLCMKLFSNLKGGAFGFLYHNPSEEGYAAMNTRIKSTIERIEAMLRATTT